MSIWVASSLPYNTYCKSINDMNHKFQTRIEKKKFLTWNLEWGRMKKKLRSFWTRKMCIRHRAIDVINNWLKTNTIQTVEAFTHATCGENNLTFVFIAIAQHISFSIWNFITLAHPYIYKPWRHALRSTTPI